MTGSNLTIPALATILLQHRDTNTSVAITSHVRPDGDAIGSCVGLYHILRAQGIAAHIIGLEPIPPRYQFLLEDVERLSPDNLRPSDYERLIVLDTGALDRAPEFVSQWQKQVQTLNIDHHPTNTTFGTHNCIISDAAAVAEIITHLAVAANWPVPLLAANALWVGIITDTGRFAYSCTTPDTLQAAAKLAAVGIDTPKIDQQVFQTLPLGALRLQARAIDRMELHEQQRLAIITLSQQDFTECGANPEDADEIINIPRRLDSVEIAILLTEKRNGTPQSLHTKASFRTRPPFDAALLCQTLGGGGHARAAGCELPCPLVQAREQILTHVQQAWFHS